MHISFFYKVAAVGALLISASLPANATQCLYPAKSYQGDERHDIRAARAAAISEWQHEVAEHHGARFASWNYAADGSVTCSWKGEGRHIRCVAKAVPCGR